MSVHVCLSKSETSTFQVTCDSLFVDWKYVELNKIAFELNVVLYPREDSILSYSMDRRNGVVVSVASMNPVVIFF